MSTNAKSLPNKEMRNDRRVLVVEDERDLGEMLRFNLERAGYFVSLAGDGRSAIQKVQEAPPDLILLDLMLPELTGTEVASRVRSNPETAHIPIIMLTAKAEEVDQIVGLSVGADDYITKPFSIKIVLARVEAVLRRTKGSAGSEAVVQRLGPIEVNQDTHEVTVSGESIKLTLTEFRLLSALIAAQGKVLSRHLLMKKAMGPGVTVTERTIDVHITAVRRKLGDAGPIIRTVRGVGYRATQEPETTEV